MKCMDQMPEPMATAPPAAQMRAEGLRARHAGCEVQRGIRDEHRDGDRQQYEPVVVSAGHD